MSVDLGLLLLPRVIHAFVRSLYATLRVRHSSLERIESLNRENRRYVLAFWHGQLMLMFFSRHRKPINVMSSLHRDGEISARTQERFGAEVIRGSSSKGGANALRQMVRAAQSGHNLAFTPDGPRGPRRIAQMGVVLAAQATGAPVVPVALIAKKKRSCDRGTGLRFRSRSRASSSYMESRSIYRDACREMRWSSGG
ncbi:MAG TPA: lysophospholipid acyltransferase family protein [Thermoanaerobaculia bacterium]|nr:lysophospholipid acyltransferase family protein [Thermoanaerobaculia bacterium]